MFKDELGGKTMTEFCALRAKTYACKLADDTEFKKAKGTKKSVIKRELMFENYKDSLFNDKIILRSQHRFRSGHHRVYTEEVSSWPYIPDHPYRILITGGSGTGKTNVLLNLINDQPDIKIYLYAKDPYEDKYQYLINKKECVGINYLNDPKAFIAYSNDMHDVYKNIDNYNPDKENKILIVFDDMIADMINNKK